MKKVLVILFALLSINFVFAQTKEVTFPINDKQIWQIVDNEIMSFRVKISLPAIQLQNVNTPHGIFTQIIGDALAISYDTGKAQLPTLNHLIEMPSENLNITIISKKEQIINLNELGFTSPIIPAQPSISKSTDPKTVPFYFDENYYNTNVFHRKQLAEIEYYGKQRGTGIGLLRINPFAYNPVTNLLEIIYEVELEVTFNSNNIKDYLNDKLRLFSPFFNFSNLLNYQNNVIKDVITDYPITYLIISPRSFENTLQPFIRWKAEKGYNVEVAYTDVIGTSTTNIKSYLQSLYSNTTPPPTFLLLVGDVDLIPSFNGTTQNSHVTDLYYACYDGSSDYLPDLYYARFSAQNATHLQNLINKTITYEKYQMPIKSYLDTVLMVAGVDNNYSSTYANGQINYATQNYFNSNNGIYSHTYLYPASSGSGVSADMISKISRGTGYANYTAHCNSAGWGDPSFTTSNVASLQNTHKYGLMVGNCCQSSKFEINECFGEAITRATNKGAVAYIGASDYSYWDEDYYWGVGYRSNIVANPTYNSTNLGAYDRVFHTHGEPYSEWFITNAQMIHGGNLAVQSSNSSLKKYYWEVYHLFGDPSTMNYFSVPDPLTISYNEPLIIGDNSLMVETEPYTLVALSSNGILLDAQYTYNSNSVNLTFQDLATDDSLLIVATKQNKVPYIEKIEVNENLLALDAKISELLAPVSSYNCYDIDITPRVTIQNLSTQNLISLNVCYSYADQPLQCVNWNGNLASLEKDTLDLPSLHLLEGDNQFIVFCENPNNASDMKPSNDTISINVKSEYKNIISNFEANVTSGCNLPFIVNFSNLSQNALSYLWDFGDGYTSTDYEPSHVYTSYGLYTVNLIADAGVCGSYTETKVNYIQVGSLPPTVHDTTICIGEDVILEAYADGLVNWYINMYDVSPIFTGNYFSISNLTHDTTLWVDNYVESPIQHVGSTQSNTNGGFFNLWTTHYLIFDCYQPVTLISVEVNAKTDGNRTISLRDENDNTIQSTTINIPAGISRVTLNFDLPVQNNLQLSCTTFPNLYRNSSGAQYPYEISNMISIKGNSAGDPDYYYYFYDWEIKGVDCISERIPITAHVDNCDEIKFFISNEFMIYPNPASDFITIELNEAIPTKLNIFSLDGRLLRDYYFSNNKFVLDVSNLTPGTYLLRLSNDNGTSQKIFGVFH